MTKFAFMHIPKCAGSSLATILTSCFKIEDVCPKKLAKVLFGSFNPRQIINKEIRDLIILDDEIESIKKYKLLTGHFALDTILDYEPKIIITILREPRSRILSHYFFWRSLPIEVTMSWLPYSVFMYAKTQSFEEFIENSEVADQIDNLLCRQIADQKLIPKRRYIQEDEDECIIQNCFERINLFSYIGFNEYFGDIVQYVSDLFSSHLDSCHINKTKYQELANKNKVSANLELMEKLNSLTRLDQQIYSICLNKFKDIDNTDEFSNKILSQTIQKFSYHNRLLA